MSKLTMADGTPAKAVLKRLINGGGKTSAIKLISAIFEPDPKRLDRGPRKFKELFGSKVGIVAVEMTVDGARPGLFERPPAASDRRICRPAPQDRDGGGA